jgi:predicted component of type VI protein secretion system
MTRRSGSRRLHLAVMNPEALEYGCRASHTFGETGGTIGGRGANWTLSDRGGRIASMHAEIVGIDGTFCLVDRCGLTRINDASVPLGTDRIVRLADGDTVQVGPYRLNVRIGDNVDDASVFSIENCSIDDILASPESLIAHDAWVERESGYGVSSAPAVIDHEQPDPLLALDGVSTMQGDADLLDATHYGLSARQEAPPDRADTMVEAFPDRNFIPHLPVLSQSPASALCQEDPAAQPSGLVVATDIRDTAKICSPVPHDAFRESLRQRGAALAQHDEALLLAVDEALRGVLARYGNDGSGERGVSQRTTGSEEAVQMFWRTCEGAYAWRMAARNE